MEIIKGTFKVTFGYEIESLQNLFGLCKLEEYIHSSVKLTQRMTEFMGKVIEFKKSFHNDIGLLLEDSINASISELNNKEETSVSALVLNELSRLEELLSTSEEEQPEMGDKFQYERNQR